MTHLFQDATAWTPTVGMVATRAVAWRYRGKAVSRHGYAKALEAQAAVVGFVRARHGISIQIYDAGPAMRPEARKGDARCLPGSADRPGPGTTSAISVPCARRPLRLPGLRRARRTVGSRGAVLSPPVAGRPAKRRGPRVGSPQDSAAPPTAARAATVT